MAMRWTSSPPSPPQPTSNDSTVGRRTNAATRRPTGRMDRTLLPLRRGSLPESARFVLRRAGDVGVVGAVDVGLGIGGRPFVRALLGHARAVPVATSRHPD